MDEQGKISVEQLMRLLAKPDARPERLRRYVRIDEAASDRPFDPRIVLNPDTVELPKDSELVARSAIALNAFNWLEKAARRRRFHERLASGYDGKVIVSEGDSWFQYPIVLNDTIDCLDDTLAVWSGDEAGDTLDNMLAREEYLEGLVETGASILLLSAGGNDAVGGGNLANHLAEFDARKTPAQHILPSFQAQIERAVVGFDKLFRRVESERPGTRIVFHGYDYVVPDNGRWLGEPMATRKIVERSFQKAIAAEMIDRFNIAMQRLAQGFSGVTFLDLRGVVGDGRWHDELHPTNAGFKAVAERFREVIDGLPKAAPRMVLAAAPARAARSGGATGRRPRKPKTAVSRRAVSLHIGLNAVDPGQYEGWSGALTACEYDASDMQMIAKGLGYSTNMLLTADATRDAVAGFVKDTAKSLGAGDILMITYSGHGGQVPDVNGDEIDREDETWCLYDGQIIDDELYMLWTAFAEDVRIVVVSDSCHSGTIVRAAPDGSLRTDRLNVADGRPDAHGRSLPRDIAGRVYRAHRAFYDGLTRDLPKVDLDTVTKELAMPLACTVRTLSGCQDNQLSYDGLANGQFTGRLLEVWNQGRFSGNYKRFHKEIVARMPDNQTPNLFTVGRPNAAFDAQSPFAI